jgi:adenylosuccinate synthase
MGVMKAYITRVGEGPLPTESEEMSDMLHDMGREFGAVTGRPRRCGWFDAVATNYARMVNGIDILAITNLDGLDSLPQIKVCVAYDCDGKKLAHPPADLEVLHHCKPIYKTFKGWKTPTGEVRSFEKLPLAAQKYLAAIAEFTGASLRIVSVGPDRDQTFKVKL